MQWVLILVLLLNLQVLEFDIELLLLLLLVFKLLNISDPAINVSESLFLVNVFVLSLAMCAEAHAAIEHLAYLSFILFERLLLKREDVELNRVVLFGALFHH
jgi:hypothetical protein